MKNKLTLIITGAVLAVANTTISAMAYGDHEHPFFSDPAITTMSQDAGNGYCKQKFVQLKATGDLGGGFNPDDVNHVWAHIENGVCIANT